MAKNIISLFALSIMLLFKSSLCATNHPEKNIDHTIQADNCNAPAPDSLWLTGIQETTVSLAWIPAQVGATHTIVVYRESSTGGWDNLGAYTPIPGAAYDIPGFTPGSYRVTIATNCTDGGPGDDDEELLFRIIDLTTAGRIPLNPVPAPICSQIDYSKHEWVGFRVKHLPTGYYNFFEFEIVDGRGLVKRSLDNLLVAVNMDGDFPVNGGHYPLTSNSFEIRDLRMAGNLQRIGFVEVFQDDVNNTIGFCVDTDYPPVQWKSTIYQFTALTAEAIMSDVPGGGNGGGQGFSQPPVEGVCTAQSPFSDHLNVFLSDSFTQQNATVQILNAHGQVVLTQKFSDPSSRISIPTESLSSGIYFIQIQTESDSQVLKTIKP